jgi:hypothetical protein
MDIQTEERDRLSSGPIGALKSGHVPRLGVRISAEDRVSVHRSGASNPAILVTSGALLLALAMVSTWIIGSVLDSPSRRPSLRGDKVASRVDVSDPPKLDRLERTSTPNEGAAQTGQPDRLVRANSAAEHGSAISLRERRQPITETLKKPKPAPPRPKKDAEAPRKTAQDTRPRSAPVPETKPTTIPGWFIREADGTFAVLDGPNGILKVSRGDTVPQVGRIDSITRWGNRWIVATSSGLISTQ